MLFSWMIQELSLDFITTYTVYLYFYELSDICIIFKIILKTLHNNFKFHCSHPWFLSTKHTQSNLESVVSSVSKFFQGFSFLVFSRVTMGVVFFLISQISASTFSCPHTWNIGNLQRFFPQTLRFFPSNYISLILINFLLAETITVLFEWCRIFLSVFFTIHLSFVHTHVASHTFSALVAPWWPHYSTHQKCILLIESWLVFKTV